MMHGSSETQNQKYDKKLKPSDSEGEDRISSLPDEILCHILSYMPTKYAVGTSLLSTRWKLLWTLVPTIDLECSGIMGVVDKDESSGFMDVVDRVLLLHNSPTIIKFQLNCQNGYYNPYRLDSWICAAIKLNVRELVLDLEMAEVVVEMPQSLFASVNLVDLRLDGDVFLRVPMPAFLPSLKVLHLGSSSSLDDDSFKKLLSGCPVLEELYLFRSQVDNVKTLCVCSSSLKKLYLNRICIRKDSFVYGVVIKAAALEILEFNDSLSKAFDVDEFPSLVQAKLNVSSHSLDNETSDDYCNDVGAMLGKISNVQHLRLSYPTIQLVILSSAYKLLLFHNLSRLLVDILGVPWSILLDLLGRMPNLKVLVVGKSVHFCEFCSWHAVPEIVPRCLSLCLETIEFSGFSGCRAEMKLVRYVLGNAMVLKKLTIASRTRSNNLKRRILKRRILKFPRGSSTCQIELCCISVEEIFHSVI